MELSKLTLRSWQDCKAGKPACRIFGLRFFLAVGAEFLCERGACSSKIRTKTRAAQRTPATNNRVSCRHLIWTGLGLTKGHVFQITERHELLQPGTPDSIPHATAIRRKRGKSLSRRIGQNGNVFQHSKPWNPTAPTYGRFWVDLSGCPERKRRTITLGICKTQSVARKKLREFIEREGINSSATFAATTTPGTAFREQAEEWIKKMQTRKRRPVKPATIYQWRQALDKWVLPNIGDMALAEVGNGVLKQLIETMTEGGLGPKTIVNYSQTVKMVVASAVDKNGNRIYPVEWNHDFCELPIVDKAKQYRPTITEAELEQVLSNSKGRYFALFALLAGTGLRIGEALAVKDTSLSPDCRLLFVKRSIWHGNEQAPKTASAVREIDIPEELAALLREYLAGKSGYLFATKSGRPMAQRNLRRALHATGVRVGFHAFRRFRTETLRRARVPSDIERLWLGHSQRTITDLYATGLQQDRVWRREWADRAGLGFSLNGLHGATNVVAIDAQQAA